MQTHWTISPQKDSFHRNSKLQRCIKNAQFLVTSPFHKSPPLSALFTLENRSKVHHFYNHSSVLITSTLKLDISKGKYAQFLHFFPQAQMWIITYVDSTLKKAGRIETTQGAALKVTPCCSDVGSYTGMLSWDMGDMPKRGKAWRGSLALGMRCWSSHKALSLLSEAGCTKTQPPSCRHFGWDDPGCGMILGPGMWLGCWVLV